MHGLLLFDLDGTLSDPIEGAVRCINHALGICGFDSVEDTHVAPFIGPPLDQAFEALTRSTSTDLIDRLIASYRERYSDVGFSECKLYPGVEQAIRQLHSYDIPLAVCTSKRADYAERILGMFGLLDLFQFVSGGEIRVPKVNQITQLRQQRLVSERTIMIGDRAVDLVAAHANGLSSGGVLWGYGSREELAAEEPLYLFGAPSEWQGLGRPA